MYEPSFNVNSAKFVAHVGGCDVWDYPGQVGGRYFTVRVVVAYAGGGLGAWIGYYPEAGGGISCRTPGGYDPPEAADAFCRAYLQLTL